MSRALRSARARTRALRPVAAFAVLFAGCDTSEAEQPPDPGAPHDATVAPSGAGSTDSGGNPAPLEAGAPDASGPAPSSNDAAATDSGLDANQESLRLDVVSVEPSP